MPLHCSDTQKKADQLFAALQKAVRSDPTAVDFLAALSATLKAVYQAVKEYRPLVQSAFGKEHVVKLVVDVVKDLDNKVGRPRIAHSACKGSSAEHRSAASLLCSVVCVALLIARKAVNTLAGAAHCDPLCVHPQPQQPCARRPQSSVRRCRWHTA